MSKLDSLPIYVGGGSSSSGGGSGGGSGGTYTVTYDKIVKENTQILASEVNHIGQLVFTTDGLTSMLIDHNQRIGIRSTNPQRMLEINDVNGQCLRLTFNDNLGRSINYADINVKSDGSLNLLPSSGYVFLPYNSLSSGLYIGDIHVTASGTQINALDVFSFGISQPEKALILDNNSNIQGINTLTATTINATNLNGLLTNPAQINVTTVGVLQTLTVKDRLTLLNSQNSILELYVNGTGNNNCFLNSYTNTSTPSFLALNNNLFVNTNYVGVGTNTPTMRLEVSDTNGNCLCLRSGTIVTNFNISPINGITTIDTNSLNISHSYNTNTLYQPLTVNSTNTIDMSQNLGTGISFNLNDIQYTTINVIRDTVNIHNASLCINMLKNNTFTNNILTLSSVGQLNVFEIYEASDARIKTNVNPVNITDILNTLMQITVKNFTFTTNDTSHVGVIAQEIKELIPDIVNVSPNQGINDFHSVKSNELVYYLIAAVQKLNYKIQDLQQQIDNINNL